MYGSTGGAPWCNAVIPSVRIIPELDARVKSGDVGVATAATEDEVLEGDVCAVDGRPTRRNAFGEAFVG